MRGIGAGNQRLGRDAAGIDAGAAEELAFDRSATFMPAVRKPPRQRRPAWPVPMMIASNFCIVASLA